MPKHIIPSGNSLHIEQARDIYQRYCAAESEAAFYALQMGIYLEWVKPQLPHGSFEAWREQQIGISKQHASKFAQAARAAMERKELKGLRPELLLGDGRERKSAEQMLLDFVDGRSQRQLFADLNIAGYAPQPPAQRIGPREPVDMRADVLIGLRQHCEHLLMLRHEMAKEQYDTACARLLKTLEDMTSCVWAPDPGEKRPRPEFASLG